MTKEFVDAVVSGDNVEAEKVFKSTISSKVGDTLEIKRQEISKSFVSNAEKVETANEDT
jgi:hypothetical protein|tara:strand:- start:1314 stop:1490 length:177 start_codon:yes stop_codon:yes gene_type:complete